MGRKKEGYAQLVNSLWTNEKMALLVEEQPRLVCLWLLSISYCSDNLTDGIVSKPMSRRLGVTPKDAKALVAARLWDVADGGWYVHDYLDYQTASDRVREVRAQTLERVHRHRVERTEASDSAVTGDVTPDVTGSVTRYTEGYVTPGVTQSVTPDVTGSVTGVPLNTKHKNLKPKTKPEKEREEKNSPPSDEFDWESALEAWEPKQQHFKLSNDQAGHGYQHVDVQDLAVEFKLSVQGKGNRYHYTDFDAAFSGWILKRSKEKPSQASSRKHPVPTEAQIEELVTRVQENCTAEGMEPPEYTSLKATAVKALASNMLDGEAAFMEVLDRMTMDA